MNHTDQVLVPGASLDASTVIRSVLASMIAGITTELRQANDLEHIDVSITPVETGLKFTFTLPTMEALATAIQADIVMSSVSMNPVQNRVIKAYVDGKFWSGTAAEYAELANKTDIICFLTDTNVVMYNNSPYSIRAHTHGNLTYAGAIGTLSGLVVMTGADGVLEAVTTEALKELLGTAAGMNLLHNGEMASPFNTKGLTIYNTAGECIDRWNLLAGTLTINAGHATLSQTVANNAQLKQMLPAGSYQRLLGQTLTLSVLLDDDETVYQDNGIIDGAATEIIAFNITDGFTARLVVDNAAKSAYVEIKGGATAVAAIDMLRVKLEIGSTASIAEGVTDAALDCVRIKAYDITGSVRVIATPYIRYDAAMTLTSGQQAQTRENINALGVTEGEPVTLRFSDESVSASDWATYTAAAGEETDIQNDGYIYRKSLALTGVLANMHAVMIAGKNKKSCGASINENGITYDGGIKLYAKSVPTAAFTLRWVVCFKELS